MKYTKRKPCDAIEALFVFGPVRCGATPTRKIHIPDPSFGITDTFHACAEHDPDKAEPS